MDGRSVAAKILDQTTRRGAFADEVLDSTLARAKLDSREAALATALVYGVLRKLYRLDRFIEAASGRPIGKTHPNVLTLLRIGAYQLMELDRIPAHAAVDAAVRAVKNSPNAHAAGFVNAVLRRIAEGASAPVTPDDEYLRLSLDHSIPPWLAQKWIEEEGSASAQVLAAHSSAEPPLFLRVDTGRTTREKVLSELTGAREAGAGKFAPEAIWVRGGSDPKKLKAVAENEAVVQEQASQLIAPLLKPLPGQRVLDACAAPGMKTLQIARMMEDEGEIAALELHGHRAERLAVLAREKGFASIRAVHADASNYRDERGFDAALVDAPCSGLGVLARNPERKWRAAPDDPARLQPIQSAILDNVSSMVRPGGVLLYATCTISRDENERVAAKFLAEHPEFEPDPLTPPDGIPARDGFFRTYPHDGGGDPAAWLDSFFAARFVRRSL